MSPCAILIRCSCIVAGVGVGIFADVVGVYICVGVDVGVGVRVGVGLGVGVHVGVMSFSPTGTIHIICGTRWCWLVCIIRPAPP